MAGCLQTVFCAFNALIAILAAACVGVGIWALVDKKTFADAITNATNELNIDGISADQISNMAILICVIGGIIMVIAGIGCCGAMKNVKCLLGVFFIAMLLISILVIVVAVLVHVFPGKLTGGITKTFKKFLDEGNETAKQEIEKYQKAFNCCGINGPDDFKGKPLAPCSGSGSGSVTEGCVDKALKEITNVSGPLFIVSIITLILLLLATAISGYLYCKGDGNAV